MQRSGRGIPRFIIVLFLSELSLLLLHILWVDLFPIHDSMVLFFHLSSEGNLPTWFSSAQLLAVSVLVSVFFLGKLQMGDTSWAMLLGALGFLFLSLDEAASVHERFGTAFDAWVLGDVRAIRSISNTLRQTAPLHKTGYWMFFLTPLTVGGFWLWWRYIKRYIVRFEGKRKLLGGFLLFVGAATIPEYFSNFIQGPGPLATLEIAVEEIGEMFGVTIFLWGMFELCVAHQIAIDFDTLSTRGS